MRCLCRNVTPAMALLTILLSTGLAAEPPRQGEANAVLSAKGSKLENGLLQRVLSARGRNRSDVLQGGVAGVVQDQHVYWCLNVQFDSAASCSKFDVPGTHVIARFDKYLDVFVPVTDDNVVAAFTRAGWEWWEIAQKAIVPPPVRPLPSEEKTRGGAPDQIVSGGEFGLTGKGVIVAIVDSGIDFNHPDFINYDQDGRPTSRILCFWDTLSDAYASGQLGSPAPISYPNGAPIGTVYSRDELTAELAERRLGRARIVEWDTNGHGTACAGIAAGNGNASKDKYQGVASQADIIAVRVGHGPGLENSYLLNAVTAWLNDMAGKRPLVVSCSFGGQNGPHDGSLIQERHLSARFSPAAPGRAICIAAGNEAKRGLHAELQFGKPGSELSWVANSEADLSIFVETPDSDDLQMSKLEISPWVRVNHTTDRTEILFELDPGAGRLTLSSVSGKSYVAHAYFSYGVATFSQELRSASRLVGEPATAAGAIAVGSYDWNDRFDQHGQIVYLLDAVTRKELSVGELSQYSNAGYLTADGFAKPDIVAPGQWFTAPASMNSRADRDTSHYYQSFVGTSAATPYMAGVIALLLEKDPSLTVGEIRQALKKAASQDQFTGSPPNPEWGYGKLNYTAVERLVNSVGR